MKFSLAALLTIFIAASFSEAAQPLRLNININRDWKFTFGDPAGAQATDFADKAWTAANLPHSFSMPCFQARDFYAGYGWYRKHLTILPEWKSKKVSVEFEAAFQDAEVYLNGTPLGRHKGGFTGFAIDLTPAVHEGDNVLAVRLNSSWNPQIEPRSGDHTFMGGIYRNVHLVVTDPLHVTWYGTFATTPVVTKQSATVDLKTEIANQNSATRTCTLATEILDPSGKSVAHLSTPQSIEANSVVNVDQPLPEIDSPKLWHPAHPYLYSAVTTVFDGGAPVDTYTTTFGIRSIKWTAEQGFFINGEHYYFHGANVHQDHAGWGDAVTDSGAFRDVKLVHDAGFDFIRGSHYPHSPAFVDACDRLGVLFWSENCFWCGGGPKGDGDWNADGYPPVVTDQPAFDRNALDTLRDEIRIHRNHPSIIVWSMCNEVFFCHEKQQVKDLLTKLVAETHQLDPSRPAAIGGCQRGGIDKLGDVAGYNGDGARIAEYQNPGIANAVTEYASHVSDRGDPKTDRYNGMFNQKELRADTPQYPWRSGQSLWCAFDYSTHLGHFGCMGCLDYFRIPKRSWYWYRNQYLHIAPPAWPTAAAPARLMLTTDKKILHGTDATDDCQILITVQDNDGNWVSGSPPVTLTIESGPGEFPTGRSIAFYPPSNDPRSDIAIRDGLAAIEFRSYFGGKTVIRATSAGLADGTITITTVGDPQFIPGQSPVVADRPYVRFVNQKKASVAATDVAADHPVLASSEAPGHSARLVNDGSSSAGWQAADGKPGAWWQVDLEGGFAIRKVETTFGQGVACQYKLEGSTDAKSWSVLAERTTRADASKVQTDRCSANEHNRYLRLTIIHTDSGEPVTIQGIKIFAVPSP
jgi:hypothetical protein